MRILMVSKRAPGTPGRRDGGVQTWTTTVAAELRRLGHDVHIGDKDTTPQVSGYDYGILANATYTDVDLSRFCRRSLLVSHGIVPDESPAGWDGPVAFTSEEVRNHWKCDGPIIRQPLDLDFWSPGKRRACRTLVRYANRGGLEWLPGVASTLGLQFVHVRNATPDQARDMLRDAACVLASGRCAVEAMACGAPVVVCDDRHYQGPLMEHAFGDRAIRFNYSGRGGGEPRSDRLETEIRAAWECETEYWRKHAERHHDVREIAQQLLGGAREWT